LDARATAEAQATDLSHLERFEGGVLRGAWRQGSPAARGGANVRIDRVRVSAATLDEPWRHDSNVVERSARAVSPRTSVKQVELLISSAPELTVLFGVPRQLGRAGEGHT